ncbi:hypothetical protein RJ640_006417 [Escallonia rubra]|uniref:Uncharacterized protein n=1 Tax=Escallonia rubra TaxID=112253 RepID=A0AA88UNK2_9ASTE|nr:hypothetical protein RJ640_006417 [Escallonia rubra]
MFQSSTAPSNALEMLCGIYQKLENAEFKYVTLVELKSMLGVVQDLESARLEVWWLRERLDEVCKALRLSRGYPNLKVALASNCQEIEIKKKELDINGQAKMEKVSLQQKQVAPYGYDGCGWSWVQWVVDVGSFGLGNSGGERLDGCAPAAAEVVAVSDVPEAEKPTAAIAEKDATPEPVKEPATAEEEKITESASFKEETNVAGELPDPEKKAVDELKQLVQEALNKHEFTAPPPPPPAKEEEKPVEAAPSRRPISLSIEP